MSDKKRWAWIGAIAVAVAATVIAEWINAFSPLSFLSDLAGSVLRWLGDDHGIKGWLLLLVSVLAGVGLVGMMVVLAVRRRDAAYLAYTKDSLLGVTWRWRYSGGGIEEYTVGPFCPSCDCALKAVDAAVYGPQRFTFQCDGCGFIRKYEGTPGDLRQTAIRLIERNIRADLERRGESSGARVEPQRPR